MRITSIKNAIKYFEQGTRIREDEYDNGVKVKTYIPPTSFERLNVTMNTGITFKYNYNKWLDYAGMLRRKGNEIVKIALYYYE